GGMPAGGVFSGTGVANGMFNPSVAGVGSHTITYSLNGQSATQTITVYPLPVVTLSASGGTIGCDNTIIIGYNNIPTVITATSTTAISYQWYHNGNLISGASGSTINITQGGNYSVIVTDANGCMSDPNAPGATININGIDVSCGNNKVLLCHYPPGKNSNPKTLCISRNAVSAHLANHPGDCLGACPGAKLSAPIIETVHYHIAPNPFTNKAKLSFMIYQDGEVKIEMLDIMGRIIKIVLEKSVKGHVEHQVEINAEGIKAGIYFLRMQSPDGVVTKQLNVVK
ncbi:MAG: T9SS type A sorting domain-containing protein, partial [Bacteroidota bacterium]|nr:T9SS type A sorting domain-containing protein [Bacteroidota bacterium]